jgi:hypothetical protein
MASKESKDKLIDDGSSTVSSAKPSSSFKPGSLANSSLSAAIEDDFESKGISDTPLGKTTTNMSVGENGGSNVIDIRYDLPRQSNPALTPPKFAPEAKQGHVTELIKVLKINYKQLDIPQREKFRQFLQDFISMYASVQAYDQNPALKYCAEAIDLVFELIKDHKHIAIDKLFSLLLILGRQCTSFISHLTN